MNEDVKLTAASPLVLRAAPGVLLLLGCLLYANSLTVPFLLDDTVSIVENDSIRRLTAIDHVLHPPASAGVGGRPLANLSFALNYAVGGLDVRGYHVVNILVHAATALTLFGVVRRTLRLPRCAERLPPGAEAVMATSVALLWLVHPLHTESVTYLSQRTEALMGLFYAFTTYAFVRALTGRATGWFIASVTACALGMTTKEVMATAPVLLLLYDRTFVAGSFTGAWTQRKRVYLALAATWIPLLFLVVDVHERGVGYAAVAWWQYALTEAGALLHYLRLALWPTPLVFDYGTDVAQSFQGAAPAALTILALLGATLWALRRPSVGGFLAAGFFLLLAPTSSFVPVAGQPLAEHRMYLPLVFVVSAAVAGIFRWAKGHTLPLCAMFAGLLGWTTFERNRDYHDPIGLWTDTVNKRPQNARAHAALGAAWLEKGDAPRAIAELERAVQLDPRSADAHNNLAMALLDAQRPTDAVRHFELSLQLRPGVASTHYNFGNALLALGRIPEAIAQQEQALVLQRDFPEARCALADAQLAGQRPDDALTNYQSALRQQPDLVPAAFGLANALLQLGRAAEAIPHYEATLRAVPNSAEAHCNLATALARTGRSTDAIRHYETALQLQPGFAAARAGLETIRAAGAAR